MTQEEMQAEIERLKQLIAQKDEVIQKQSVQIENMMQVLLHARKESFGAKSEASIPGQMSLFSDAEQEALAKALEEQKQELAVPDKKPSVAKKSGTHIQCLSPAKKYKLYKSSINKSLHFGQRSLSSSPRG